MGGILKEAWQVLLPLRVVSKLLLNSDPENSLLIGCELGLPHLLFDLTSVMVDKLSVIKVNMLNVIHSRRREILTVGY